MSENKNIDVKEQEEGVAVEETHTGEGQAEVTEENQIEDGGPVPAEETKPEKTEEQLAYEKDVNQILENLNNILEDDSKLIDMRHVLRCFPDSVDVDKLDTFLIKAHSAAYEANVVAINALQKDYNEGREFDINNYLDVFAKTIKTALDVSTINSVIALINTGSGTVAEAVTSVPTQFQSILPKWIMENGTSNFLSFVKQTGADINNLDTKFLRNHFYGTIRSLVSPEVIITPVLATLAYVLYVKPEMYNEIFDRIIELNEEEYGVFVPPVEEPSETEPVAVEEEAAFKEAEAEIVPVEDSEEVEKEKE